jgi:hypothetical protein
VNDTFPNLLNGQYPRRGRDRQLLLARGRRAG